MMKKKSATTRTTVFVIIIFIVAIIMDNLIPVEIELPRAGVLWVFCIFIWTLYLSISPFFTWKSPSLITYDGVIPLNRAKSKIMIAKSRNPSIPDMVIIRKGYNVGETGFGPSLPLWIIAPAYLLEQFVRHMVLHTHLYRPKHTFLEDYPWIGEVLESMGYKQPEAGGSTTTRNQVLLVGAFTFMKEDEEYEKFDMKQFKDVIVKSLSDVREPERIATEDTLTRIKKIRSARGASEYKQSNEPIIIREEKK